ncbi:MAG: hypothetical protein AAFQ52_15195, partial [Chloroflexota bacterium]
RIRERRRHSDDTPMLGLSIEDYINIRVRSYLNWYANRVETESRDFQDYFILALVISFLGSVLSFLGLVELVAISAALATAISLNSDVRMYGYTYGIYHLTAVQLENAMTAWHSDEARQSEPEYIMKFVCDVEKILMAEIVAWSKQAKQAQERFRRRFNESNEETQGNGQDSSAGEETPAS